MFADLKFYENSCIKDKELHFLIFLNIKRSSLKLNLLTESQIFIKRNISMSQFNGVYNYQDMSASVWLEQHFKDTLSSYFQSFGITLDLPKVIQKLKGGATMIPTILRDHKFFPDKKFTLLETALQSQEFFEILNQNAATKNAIQSEKFLQLEKIFQSIEKGKNFFTILIKIHQESVNEQILKQLFSKISKQEEKKWDIIFKSDAFRNWANIYNFDIYKLGVNSFQQKNQNQSSGFFAKFAKIGQFLGFGGRKNETTPEKQKINSLSKQQIRKKKLLQLFNIVGSSQSIVAFVDSILRGESQRKNIGKLKAQINEKQYPRLSNILRSQEYLIIKNQIRQEMCSQLMLKKKNQLLQMLKPFKFNKNNFIQNVLLERSQINSLISIKNQLDSDQYDKFYQFYESQSFLQFKKKLKSLNNDDGLFEEEIKNELYGLFKGFSHIEEDFISAIINDEQIDLTLLEINQPLSRQELGDIQKILNSEQMKKIRYRINKNKKLKQANRIQMINKIDINQILRPFTFDKKQLINSILKGDSAKQQLIVRNISNKMTNIQLINLKNVLKSKQMKKFRPVNQYQELMNFKRKKLTEIFQRFDINSFSLIQDMIYKRPISLSFQQLSQRWSQEQQLQFKQIMNSEQVVGIIKLNSLNISNKSEIIPSDNESLERLNPQKILTDFLIKIKPDQITRYMNSQRQSGLLISKIGQFKTIDNNDQFVTQFLHHLNKDIPNLKQAITKNDFVKQKSSLHTLYESMSPSEISKIQDIIYSPQFIKLRCQKLKMLQISSKSYLQQNFYIRFSSVLRLLGKFLHHNLNINFNIYHLAHQIMLKVSTRKLLNQQSQILKDYQYTLFQKFLNSRQLFVIIQNTDIQNIQLKVELKYLFRELNNPQPIINIILEANNNQMLTRLLERQKKSRDSMFNNQLDQIMKQDHFQDIKAKIFKKHEIMKLLVKRQYQELAQLLVTSNSFNIQLALNKFKKKIGPMKYQSIIIILFSQKMKQISQLELFKSQKVKKIMHHFHKNLIPISSIEFIQQLLKEQKQKFIQITASFRNQFTQSTFQRIKDQLSSPSINTIFLSLNYQNFEDFKRQISNFLSFIKSNEILANSIISGSNINELLQQILQTESLESLQKLYQLLASQHFLEKLMKFGISSPIYVQKFVVEKAQKRYLYPKGITINEIKLQKSFNYSKMEVFMSKRVTFLNDDYKLQQHIECLKGEQYEIQFQKEVFSILLPIKLTVEQCKIILKKQFYIGSEVCIQIKRNDKFIILDDKSPINRYIKQHLFLQIYINLIIKIQGKQQEQTFRILNNETITQIKIKIESISMKKESQKWYIDDKQVVDYDNTSFESLEIRQQYVRVKVIEDRSLEYYGFDSICPIERSMFKNFFIQDDEQTIQYIRSSDFPSFLWGESFRRVCLGYIFSGIKKHSKIQSCLNHIKHLVELSGKDSGLWKPKTYQQKRYFNQTYVIYNILKSSDVELRTDIFKSLMTLYPIPLLMYNQGIQMKLYQENYWIMNKAFTIVSFSFPKIIEGKIEQIYGKSSLLNICFETNFQERINLHQSCSGGISIQYNVYQNDQYFINLIDISNKISCQLILKLVKASNMVIIHAKQTKQSVIQQWIQENRIIQPVIIFKRDVKNIFKDESRLIRHRQKEHNLNNNLLKQYSLPQLSESILQYYNIQFNQIFNSVQKFVRYSYLNIQDSIELWRFSDFLAKQCSQRYLQFNQILKDLQNTQQDLSKITDYFYEWKFISYDMNITKQKQNANKMQKIKKKAENEGISNLIKKIIAFYQDHTFKSIQIMSKLRIFLTLIRNQLFRDFDELYKLIKAIAECKEQFQFKQKKSSIISLLNNIYQMKSSLTTPKIKKRIQQFNSVHQRYKSASNLDDVWKQIFKDITSQFQYCIQPKTFSIENFWRQVIYMIKFNPSYTFDLRMQEINLKQAIISLSKKQINSSENFQLINGDLLEMPNQFLGKVFQNQQNKKIMIVAIFGPQSSGKSTLLNFVLGCDFMSSAGRCTKGIYGTYFEISNKQIPNCEAILVLDTEGLFSNYKNDKFQNRQQFDNKLVLFCLQVCDLIIMNIKGDMTFQCQQILANAFDSEAIDSKNLPQLYFVLNCNGGPVNTTQMKQIQKACEEIIKLNSAAKNVVSSSNSTGMPMAFNQIPRKSRATQIMKYMMNKKIPSQLFYKQTILLSNEIFKILSKRGRQRNGRTLGQAIKDMGLTWATINRFSILTNHKNRKIKQLQQRLQQWIKVKKDFLQQKLLESKKQLILVRLKDIEQWQKNQINQLKDKVQQIKNQFNNDFPGKNGENVKLYNRCIGKAYDDLENLFEPILEDLKRSVIERRYRLQMQQSQRNGLDDINNLVKSIKGEQLAKNIELSQEEKQEKFEKLWNKKMNDLKEGLNRNIMAAQDYKNMKQMYDVALKSSDPTKTIYKIQQAKGIIELNVLNFEQFNQSIKKKISQKYRQQTIFQSSKQKPIMNIEKKTGDLSFKYLDMSKYFQKSIQKLLVCFRSNDLLNCLDSRAIEIHLKEKLQKALKNDKLVEDLHHDIRHLTGFSLKKKWLEQWVNAVIFQQRWYQIFINRSSFNLNLLIHQQGIPRQQMRSNSRTNKVENCYMIYFNQEYFNNNYANQIFQSLRLFNHYPNFLDQIKNIIREEKCPNTIQGNNVIIQKILSKLQNLIMIQLKQKQIINGVFYGAKKIEVQSELRHSIVQDLQDLNISIENIDEMTKWITNSSNLQKIRLISNNFQIKFKSLNCIKQRIFGLSKFWDKEKLLKSFIKHSDRDFNRFSLIIGYIDEAQIIVKQEFSNEKILQTYIGKQYDEFLNEIQKSNFKKFIEKELRYEGCFKQISQFIFQKKLSQSDLNFSITTLKNKVNQILHQINKDLQQVSQKLRFDFIIDLHSYAFHLVWITTFQYSWKNRYNLIIQYNNKKQAQYNRFLGLSSGKADQENKASSLTFVEQYTMFLNRKIAQTKQLNAIDLAKRYNSKYKREKIQQQVEASLERQNDDLIVRNYLLNPVEYIQKILRDQVKACFLNDFEKLSSSLIVDYKLIVRQLIGVVAQIYSSLPDIKDCSIQQTFDINLLDQNRSKAFIQFFSQIILKQQNNYISSEEKMGSFQLKKGRRFEISQSCKYQQNIEFLKHIQYSQITITNIKYFCQFLQQQLSNFMQTSQILVQVTKQDKINAQKHIKIQICQRQCPLCNKSCEVDMIINPHHTIHSCFSGHQIRAIKGFATSEIIQGNQVYKASILRCEDLTPDSIFHFDGKYWKWAEFKLFHEKQWNFQVGNRQIANRSFYVKLWRRVGKIICQYHTKSYGRIMQFVQYNEQSIQRQTKISARPAHYIFAIDESGSMIGNRWQKALNSLKNTIQDISNINVDKNQSVSLLKFNTEVSIVYNSISPQNFNKDAVTFSSGFTSFSPVFQAAIQLIKKNLHQDNIFIFISDGQAKYPKDQVNQIKRLISSQKSKGHNLSYTSIFIGDIPNQINPLMERITTELNGKHNVVIDAEQISGLLKEIHFKGG